MSSNAKGQVTQLIDAAAGGDAAAVDAFWSSIHDELRQMAAGLLQKHRSGPMLQPTMVINEVYMRLCPKEGGMPNWDNRRHFFGSVARGMNQFLIDHARSRNRKKRGGDRQRVSFEITAGELASTNTFDDDRLARAGEAFKNLQEQFPRQAEVAYLRWMQGWTIEQTAAALDVSSRTVVNEWKLAQAWLRRELSTVEESDAT